MPNDLDEEISDDLDPSLPRLNIPQEVLDANLSPLAKKYNVKAYSLNGSTLVSVDDYMKLDPKQKEALAKELESLQM